MCIHKPDQACNLCHVRKTKCEWPSKSAKPSTSASSPTRDRPVVLVPTPKWESLEVRLEVDCEMVVAMQNLMDAMGHLGMGSSTCSGMGGEGERGGEDDGDGPVIEYLL